MKFPTYKYEQTKLAEGFTRIAGCDEVGVAPLAGPVVAAAVILDPASIGKQRSKSKWWYRVRDSKTVNEKEREELEQFIKEHALDFAVAAVNREIIDELNIFYASQLAMKQAIEKLNSVEFVFIDGKNKIKNLSVSHKSIIKGDMKILSIASASIIAKVARDKILKELDEQFPQYGFVKHKGYPTKQHKAAILRFGPTPFHRRSFQFVQQCLTTVSS